MDFPTKITIGDKYAPAMKITDQAEADEYFAACVRHSVAAGLLPSEADAVERTNLGYFAGYYDHETRERVERLFKCAHPVFGSIAQNGPPTAEEAFNKGYEMGRPN